jgi:hypothetical protein
MNPKTLKLIAIGYVVKTLLIGIVWLVRPDLTDLALAKARETWLQISGEPER